MSTNDVSLTNQSEGTISNHNLNENKNATEITNNLKEGDVPIVNANKNNELVDNKDGKNCDLIWYLLIGLLD
jgi:hypothetical protein